MNIGQQHISCAAEGCGWTADATLNVTLYDTPNDDNTMTARIESPNWGVELARHLVDNVHDLPHAAALAEMMRSLLPSTEGDRS